MTRSDRRRYSSNRAVLRRIAALPPLTALLRLAALPGIAVALPASAHHSPVAFDTRVTDFSISGTIESVDVRNPHSVMAVRVEHEDGSATVWDIEFSSVNLLLRRGWDFERLAVGETVTCTGNPSASGKNEMYMWSIAFADGTEFSR